MPHAYKCNPKSKTKSLQNSKSKVNTASQCPISRQPPIILVLCRCNADGGGIREQKSKSQPYADCHYTLVAQHGLEGITLGLDVRLKAAGLTEGFVSVEQVSLRFKTRWINFFGARTYLSDWSWATST